MAGFPLKGLGDQIDIFFIRKSENWKGPKVFSSKDAPRQSVKLPAKASLTDGYPTFVEKCTTKDRLPASETIHSTFLERLPPGSPSSMGCLERRALPGVKE